MKRVVKMLVLLMLATALPGIGLADQNSPKLEALFVQLKAEKAAQARNEIEAQIWAEWLDHPDPEAAAQLNRAVTLFNEGQPFMALALLDQLVVSHADWAEAWNKRATFRFMMGNMQGSLADIDRTLALEPRHFGAMAGAAGIYERREELDKALEYYEDILKWHPHMPQAQVQRHALIKRLGPSI